MGWRASVSDEELLIILLLQSFHLLTTNMSDITREPYILYHNLFSSCSLMVRLAIAVSKTTKEARPVQFVERQFDIQHKDEVDGFYMCENPTGQVSVTLIK